MLGAFGFWGARTGTTPPMQWGLGLGTPLIAGGIWAMLVAPASNRRLSMPWRLLLEAVIFGAAVVALVMAEQVVLAWIFGMLVLVNWTLMILWKQ